MYQCLLVHARVYSLFFNLQWFKHIYGVLSSLALWVQVHRSTVPTFNQACLSMAWSHWLFAAAQRQTCTDSIFVGGKLNSWPEYTYSSMQTVKLIHKYSTHTRTHTLYAGVLSPQTKSTHHLFFFPKDSLSFLLSPDFLFARGLSSQTRIDPELPSWTCALRAAQCKHAAARLHLLQSWLHSLLHYIHISTHTTDAHSKCQPSLPGLL